jgi:hypothetical protein
MRGRAHADGGSMLPCGPGYSPPGTIAAALGAAAGRYQAGADFGDADAVREKPAAEQVLLRLRAGVVMVCAPAFLIGGIGAACHVPLALWLAGMLVFATGMTGGGLVTLLAGRQPVRWVPRLRETAYACCLFGSIPAVVFLGSGLASGGLAGGARITPAIGLAFLPAALLGTGGMVLRYATHRMHPYARAMSLAEWDWKRNGDCR